jgi:hypothetical protein
MDSQLGEAPPPLFRQRSRDGTEPAKLENAALDSRRSATRRSCDQAGLACGTLSAANSELWISRPICSPPVEKVAVLVKSFDFLVLLPNKVKTIDDSTRGAEQGAAYGGCGAWGPVPKEAR